MTVQIEVDGHSVMITRGRGLSEYRLRGLTEANPVDAVYAKSGTSVPVDVRELLNLPELEDRQLWWSTQHDPPFLLSEPGSKVSAVLGRLTSATTLHEATRIATRRKSAARTEAKIREADVESARDQIVALGDVIGRRVALQGIRSDLDAVRAQSLEINILEGLVGAWETATTTLAAADEVLTHTESLMEEISEHLAVAQTLIEERDSLAACLLDYQRARAALPVMNEVLNGAEIELSTAQSDLLDALHEAGTCPTCGQSTAGAQIGHLIRT